MKVRDTLSRRLFVWALWMEIAAWSGYVWERIGGPAGWPLGKLLEQVL